MMTKRLCALTFALILMAAAISGGCGPKKTELSAADQQKMTALADALKSGILTQAEYDAKVKDLNAAAAAGTTAAKQASAADAQKLQALESACKSGVLSADECAAKRAALTGTSPAPAQDATPVTGMAVVSAPADAPAAAPSAAPAADNSSGAMPSNPQMAGNGGGASGNPPMANAAGNTYNDPQGAFRVIIPQGWSASPQGENGARGVQIAQGTSWAIISPFGNAKQPSDVVISVEGQLQGQYKNMAIGNHGPAKFQGKLDMAYARYTGINPQGAAVTMVIIGIACPDGRLFLVMSSIPQNDTQNANAAMTAMVQSLHFTGE
jgi:hypothetical protein